MLSVADQRRHRRCRNRRRCNIRHCSCESSNRPRVRPARQNIIGEFDERSLVNYYAGRPRVHACSRARIWFVPKNANYEFLRCNSNVISSESPGRFSPLSLFHLTFFLSLSRTGEDSLPDEESRSIIAAYGVGIPRLRAGIHKIFRSTFNDDVAVFRARELYTGGTRVTLLGLHRISRPPRITFPLPFRVQSPTHGLRYGEQIR